MHPAYGGTGMEIIDGKWYMEGIDWDDEGAFTAAVNFSM